jgi:hypothetical protein
MKDIARVATEGDLEVTRAYMNDFSKRFEPFSRFPVTGQLFESSPLVLQDSFLPTLHEKALGKIQITEPAVCLSNNPNEELGYLFRTFVDVPRPERQHRESPFRKSVKKELSSRRLLADQTQRAGLRGFEVAAKVYGGESRVQHEVDFLLQNGIGTLVKTVDLTLKQERAKRAEGFEAAFVLSDIMHGAGGRFQAYAIVNVPKSETSLDYYLRILEAHSEVFIYNDDRRRGEFIHKMENLVKGTRSLF